MSGADLDALHPSTLAVTLGRPPREPGAPISPPVSFTSTYVAEGEVGYARVGNPTWTALEAALGGLEGGQALAFSSGMAAVDAALALVPGGGVVVAPRHAYNTTTALLTDLADRGRVGYRPVDIADTAQVVAALDGAALLHIESPTNPMMEVADLPTLVAAARSAGVLVTCDNTFATPLLQQPLRHGVDVVVHSATKYLSGHSDVVLGATITAPTDRGAQVHERLLAHRTLRGAIPGPMEAWLVLRGLRTLDVRLERAGRSADELAQRLATHPAVDRVRYPGYGAMLAIEVRGDAAAADRVCAAVQLWVHSTSLGGVESQIERRRRHPLEATTVPEHLLRLSVGIEHLEDLWADLEQALRTVG